ncbi:MAG: redoxin domain-containing protein [Verrucomicrobiae bacterium]|nr:redoxin domain-containing protein [Verrucomicrobiae bacterium]
MNQESQILRASAPLRETFSLIAILCLLPFLAPAADLTTLAPGAKAPDFDLPGVDGKNHTLAEYADAEILAVLFTCNHCPSAQGAESRFKKLVTDYADKSFQLIAISPNDPLSIRLNELGYAVYGDTLEEMKKHAKDQGFTFPYLYDGETQSVSKAFGVTATPQIFIFDKERVLRYVGRIDDSRYGDESLIKTHEARDAIEALIAGKEVAVPQTRAHGCSTKWADKREAVLKYNAEFKEKPVTLEPIAADALKKLRANGTDKLRLINLWATWCGPCVAEMPSLVAAGRQFETRGFDMITISLDDAAAADKALKLLQRNHAALPKMTEESVKEEGRATNNYHWTGDPDALAEIVDPEWPGALPHTILVAPGGEIISRHTGEIDADQLRREIVAHLGRFYTPE